MKMKKKIEEIVSQIQNCSIKEFEVVEFFNLLKKQQKDYKDFEFAGNGAFSMVIKALNTKTNKIVALKVVECDKSLINGLDCVQYEYNLLNKLSGCNYLVKVFNCFYLTKEVKIDSDSEDEVEIQESKMKSAQIMKVFFVLELEYCQSNPNFIYNLCYNKKIENNHYTNIYQQFKQSNENEDVYLYYYLPLTFINSKIIKIENRFNYEQNS